MNTREKIIILLERAKGSYVSGETLAGECNVSRNAIWKNIMELRKNGYAIESANNKGYMLDKTSDIISKAGICMYLESITGERPAKNADRIHVYDMLDSTNNEAKRGLLFNEGFLLHGSCIIAKQQSAGRGHCGSSFSSPEGGIYLSVILEPEKIKNKDVFVTDMTVKAVSAVIENIFHIKTTRNSNGSLYVGEEKVCGILTEGICDLETGIYSNYIAGIGIRAEKLKDICEANPQKNEIIAELISVMRKEMST